MSIPVLAARDGDRGGTLLELGATVGTPAGLNAVLGLWGPRGFPLGLRASGMYFGKRLQGAQGELIFIFGGRRRFINYFGAAGMSMKTTDKNWTAAGPVYGFNMSGFALEGGLSFGRGSFRNPQAFGQIGYTYLW